MGFAGQFHWRVGHAQPCGAQPDLGNRLFP